MHTPLCHHASGEPTEYAAQALKIGLTEIGMSDHGPMIRDDFDDWHMRQEDLDLYVEKVRKAQTDHPSLSIKLGLEMDYLPGHEDWIRDVAGRHAWDYFIGSVHYVSDTWAMDNPHRKEEWQNHDVDEIWLTYCERLTLAAESGLFEIIGHADLCKKFGYYPQRDGTAMFAGFLDAAAKSGVAIELNTGGLRRGPSEIYPSRSILAEAQRRRIPITFGSDAHAPDQVGADFSKATALAQDAGYRHCLQFTGRQKEEIRIAT